jgi:hypothetical protein
MKTYVVTTGAVFGLLVLVHVARIFAEGLVVAKDPFFALSTLTAGSLSFWAWRLSRKAPSPPSDP